MEAFLKTIANSVSKENLPYLYTRCYIFPTKRAAIYFTDFLKKKHKGENFILPETITIQDFITNNLYSSLFLESGKFSETLLKLIAAALKKPKL